MVLNFGYLLEPLGRILKIQISESYGQRFKQNIPPVDTNILIKVDSHSMSSM
jgi:hypothetical protein